MTPRDPRMDPRPGDVIRQAAKKQDVLVMARKGDAVYFSRADLGKNFSILGFVMKLSNWRELAKDAEVVK